MRSNLLKYFLFMMIVVCNIFPQNESKDNKSNEISRLYEIINRTKLLNKFQVMNYREILDIAAMTDKRIVVTLVDFLGPARPVVQQQILLKLAEFKIPATAKKIMQIAKDSPNWWVRSVAVEALINLEQPYIFPSLFAALDDPKEFVQEMAVKGLNQLISTDDIPIDKSLQKDRDFWKKNQEIILEKYKDPPFPDQDFFYYDPVYQFRIKKLEDFWQCHGRVNEKDNSIKYMFKWAEKDYDIWIWGEKDKRPDKSNYDAELEKIKQIKMKELKEFKSSTWREYKELPWTAYEIRYYGKYESDILYFHSLIVIFAHNNIYFLETADAVKTKDKALEYFFNFVKNFEILIKE